VELRPGLKGSELIADDVVEDTPQQDATADAFYAGSQPPFEVLSLMVGVAGMAAGVEHGSSEVQRARKR